MPNKWTIKDDTDIFHDMTYFGISTDNEYIYSICGFDSLLFGVDWVRKYDNTGTKTNLASLPSTPRWNGVSCCVEISGNERNIYSGLGVTVGPTVYYDDWFEYNILNNSWTQKASFFSGRNRAAYCVINNRIYVGLGIGSGFPLLKVDWWMYNHEDDSWTQKTSFPNSAGLMSSSIFTIGNSCYVGGGQQNASPVYPSTWWKYNSIEDNWLQLGDGPVGRWSGSFFTIDNYGYYGLGDAVDEINEKELWQYNSIKDKWVRMADLPIPSPNGAMMATIGKKAYLVEGNFGLFYEWDGPPLLAYRFIHSKKRIHDRRGSIRENV